MQSQQPTLVLVITEKPLSEEKYNLYNLLHTRFCKYYHNDHYSSDIM